jgi:hypothetical protein
MFVCLNDVFILYVESFYLLSFVSWLHPFRDKTKWEFRAGNNGFFAATSIIFLFAQIIVLFDLSYEEDLAAYRCEGNSARPSTVICGILVTVIVAFKMLPEERRCFAERLLLIRHATELSFLNSSYHLLTSNDKFTSFKTLCLAIFHNFRVYGVVSFVYVAAMEQLMLFDSALDYIINAVVVLVIAELDELAFKSLSSMELKESKHRHQMVESADDGDEVIQVGSDTGHAAIHRPNGDAVPSVVVSGGGRQRKVELRGDHGDHGGFNGLHESEAQSVAESTELTLSKREKDVFLTYDYLIVRCNALAMVLPLTRGKLTGANCSELSFLRVSEIGMIFLLVCRVLLNVYVDLTLQKHKSKGYFFSFAFCISSLLEHAVPCVLYLVLMYFIFVKALKPPTEGL